MKSIAEYCQHNILIIPQALHNMKDVSVVLQNKSSVIFHKSLATELTDVEFHTNQACFIYIESGSETITTHTNKPYQLTENTVTFLPKGLNLHSDYFKTTGNLTAFLIFIDVNIIEEFLSSVQKHTPTQHSDSSILKIKASGDLTSYFTSIDSLSKQVAVPPALVKVKLLEFLHLLALSTSEVCFISLFSSAKASKSRRNITRLMNNLTTYQLSISDLAHLSGRNLSSFNRDFKAIYQIPPKQWLQEKRLNSAYHNLLNTELSVTQVALDLGYENISHFIKSFKEKFNMTPKQFKLNN